MIKSLLQFIQNSIEKSSNNGEIKSIYKEIYSTIEKLYKESVYTTIPEMDRDILVYCSPDFFTKILLLPESKESSKEYDLFTIPSFNNPTYRLASCHDVWFVTMLGMKTSLTFNLGEK